MPILEREEQHLTKTEFKELVEDLCIAEGNYRTLLEDERDENCPGSIPKAIKHFKEQRELVKTAVLDAYDAVLEL
ncbi:MAG: hypothetical protein OXL40_06695 [Bacteroidota bacterium]|nr:hypothetical protein [Bacteroidota bacterium]